MPLGIVLDLDEFPCLAGAAGTRIGARGRSGAFPGISVSIDLIGVLEDERRQIFCSMELTRLMETRQVLLGRVRRLVYGVARVRIVAISSGFLTRLVAMTCAMTFILGL